MCESFAAGILGTTWIPGALGGQKSVPEPLELELEVAVSHMDAGEQTQILERSCKEIKLARTASVSN